MRYIVNWLQAAQRVHNLTISFVGVWNERAYTADYIVSLHAAIRGAGLATRVVGHDSNWDICAPVTTNAALAAAVDVIGAHYPGTHADPACELTQKPLWASEDYAAQWNTGAQCLARIINQNYVRANITATIAWNLMATYYDDLPFPGDGLLHGVQPWSGHFDIGHSVWVASHTTHFTQPGWHYLARGAGVGLLDGGGSYVSLTDPNGTELTIVIELMPFNGSQCSWSTSPTYTVSAQNATFLLDSTFADVKGLYLVSSNLSNAASVDGDFTPQRLIPVVNGAVTLPVFPEMLYTLSTLTSSRRFLVAPPAATSFPLPYADDFDAHVVDSEAPYFFDQTGSWQVQEGDASHGRVMRQQVLQPPVAWCGENAVPYSVIGDHAWRNVNVTVQVMVERAGRAFVSARVAEGGCVGGRGSEAAAFGVSTDGWWALCNSTDFSDRCAAVGKMTVTPGRWYTLSVVVVDGVRRGYIDGTLTATAQGATSTTGWAGIGSSWSYVQFDRFSVSSSSDTDGRQRPEGPRASAE